MSTTHEVKVISAKKIDTTVRGYVVLCSNLNCDCVYETFGTKREATSFAKAAN